MESKLAEERRCVHFHIQVQECEHHLSLIHVNICPCILFENQYEYVDIQYTAVISAVVLYACTAVVFSD